MEKLLKSSHTEAENTMVLQNQDVGINYFQNQGKILKSQ
jgi:hypothetical protein